jgi:hypothetical protein
MHLHSAVSHAVLSHRKGGTAHRTPKLYNQYFLHLQYHAEAEMVTIIGIILILFAALFVSLKLRLSLKRVYNARVYSVQVLKFQELRVSRVNNAKVYCVQILKVVGNQN